MIWTDAQGRTWEIVDFHRPSLDPNAKAKPLEVGHWKAEGRAFTPRGWDGPTMLFDFGRIAYRDTEDRTLSRQLAQTYRAGAPTGERMNPRGPDAVR